jgi:hypothetical protein
MIFKNNLHTYYRKAGNVAHEKLNEKKLKAKDTAKRAISNFH